MEESGLTRNLIFLALSDSTVSILLIRKQRQSLNPQIQGEIAPSFIQLNFGFRSSGGDSATDV